MELTNKQITVIFKALCDENRVQIFRLLQKGERCACELLEAMQLSQPTLSHHMKILTDSGLVVGRKEGRWMHYSISEEGVRIALGCIEELTTVSGGGEECCCCK
ncbi:ArsR family transcriptional regulator [Ruminococcus sp. YE71]|uniref:ArsR/SmtB family transcription factor n=1 Tax=unclassified Ruminococcus TaxID=2608920 RepID=UPI0008863E4D|nr:MULTISPECIES: metalloregulator ArsR/SmtB family transcription factor [unclassified Ruminococcus]SDA21833.1 ArsR family transcriptional regulator [Ruminococcus sp. YE78]SFW36944.1 ArsR family transcriptional regulator [Ruminococcus sp. YE71]